MARKALSKITSKGSAQSSPSPTQLPQSAPLSGTKPIQGIVAPPRLVVPTTQPVAMTSVQQAVEERHVAPIAPRNYEEMYERIAQHAGLKPLTPEEQAKEERRKRVRATIGAVGDAISSMANIYFAHKGAPPVQQTSITGRLREHYDRLDAQRRDQLSRYGELVQRGRQMDIDNDRYNQQFAYKRANDARTHALAVGKAAREAEELRIKGDRLAQQGEVAKSQVSLNNAREKTENVRASYEPRLRRSQIARNLASAEATRERARYYRDGGGGKTRKVQVFAYGDGSLEIDDRVLKGSLPQVYGLMEKTPGLIKPIEKINMTPAKMESIIRERWNQSPEATEMMLKLSSINPDRAQDDDVIEWGDDDNNDNDSNSIQWD